MAKTWGYRGRVIEEDFQSLADRAPRIFLKNRTGYFIRGVPGRYDTLAEARRGVDEELKEGGWMVKSVWAKHRMIAFDHEPDHKYPYVCVSWREVGGMNCGDRFTQEVGDVLIEALREDGIEIVVNEDTNASTPE